MRVDRGCTVDPRELVAAVGMGGAAAGAGWLTGAVVDDDPPLATGCVAVEPPSLPLVCATGGRRLSGST
jgi:hypothetical protein